MLQLSRWAAIAAAIAMTVVGAPNAAAQNNAGWIQTPSTGASAAVGEVVVISGYAMIGEGTGPDRVEITFDEGDTWTEADGLYAWRYQITPTQPGDITFQVRAWFAALAEPQFSDPRTLHVGTPGSLAPITCPCSLHAHHFPPLDVDPLPVELGQRFSVDRPGRVTGLVFTRGTYQGPVTARVWGPGGVLLHQQAVPTTIGTYAHVDLTTAVPVQPGADYVVSYHTPQGGYRVSEDFYTGTLYRAPFVVRADAGVYRYGVDGGFPTDTWNHSNYEIYPVFRV
jgi:hypothetical protein